VSALYVNDTCVLKMKLLCEYIHTVSHLVLSSQYIFSLYSLSSNKIQICSSFLQSVMTFREALSSFMTHFFLLLLK